MKKTILTLTALCLTAAFASCDVKTCYCYYYNSDGTVYETAETVNTDQSCNALSTGDSQVGTRVCLESSDRMDPNDLASKHKRSK